MAVGWQQLLIVLALVLLLFGGRGRISSLMGDMAKGIKSFRSGLKDEEAEHAARDGARDGARHGARDGGTLTAAPPPGDAAITTEPVAPTASAPSAPASPAEAPARRDA